MMGITIASDEEDDLLNMEVEENLGFTSYPMVNPANQEYNFEHQLRDIDSAVGFCP